MSANFTFLRTPWKHQREAVERALPLRDFALLMDMGVGKTFIAINILRGKYMQHGRVLKTLVLCPVAVTINWQREFGIASKLGPSTVVLSGSEKKRLAVFEQKIQLKDTPIFITNFEALQMKSLMQAMLKWGIEVLVVDESQKLKNPTGKRSKMAFHLADQALHRYILSGSPILNSPMDIWAQYRILDKGESFLDGAGNPINFWTFRARYFDDANAGMPKERHFPNLIPREETIQHLHKIIYRKAMRVMKHECLDLPDLVRVRIPVELSAEQKRLYDEMRKHYLTYLNENQAVTAQIAITKSLRLQQIVSGYAKTEDGEEITLHDNPRLSALESLLEDLVPNEKVIVWATFQENYRQIAAVCNKLGIEFTELHGGTSAKDRQANIDRFQTDPTCRVFLSNQAAGGVGVNLTAASAAIYYSRNFSLEQDLQSEARNYRGGSEVHQKITRYDLVAENTIDEIILDALARKLNTAEQVLALKEKL